MFLSASHARPARAQSRTFGVGSVVGGGLSYNVRPDLVPPHVAWGPQADSGTLELRVFLPSGATLDAYSQLGNTLVSGALAALPHRTTDPGVLFFASLAALYNANIPLARQRGDLWLAAGIELAGDLGLAGSYVASEPLKAAVRVPLRVAYELLAPGHRVGVIFALRALIEPFGYARAREAATVSQGFATLAEVGVMFYGTRRRTH